MKERATVLDRPRAETDVPHDITPETLDIEIEEEALEAQAMASVKAEEAKAEAGTGAQAVREAYEKATSAARGRTAPVIEDLADRVGARASVSAAFGDPVVRGALTVVPVARVAWGFGGGSGEDPQGAGGTGAGGGSMVRPIGYLEITDGLATFRPLRPAWADPALILSSAFAGWLVLRAVRALVRR
jgi:hypothetical protein